jgi:cyclopropane fatty-acyl-phospholipid synthase-like methyltransferase
MIIIFIIIFITYIILTLYYERQGIIFNLINNNASMPIPFFIKDEIIYNLQKIKNYKDYTFIDFGCGYGEMIYNVKNLFNNVIGTELDKHPADYSINKFKNNKNVKILNMDMVDYKFDNVPTILYIYEPLWLLDKNTALDIYMKVLNNISKVNNVYIFYCSGTSAKPLTVEIFNQFNFKQIYHKKMYRGFYFPFVFNDFYIYKTIF